MCGKLTKMLKKYNAENSKRLEDALMSDEDTRARVVEEAFEDLKNRERDEDELNYKGKLFEGCEDSFELNRPVNILIALDKAITANLGANFKGKIIDVILHQDGMLEVKTMYDDERRMSYHKVPNQYTVGELLELRSFIGTKLK